MERKAGIHSVVTPVDKKKKPAYTTVEQQYLKVSHVSTEMTFLDLPV